MADCERVSARPSKESKAGQIHVNVMWNGFDVIFDVDSMAVVGGERQLQLIIVYFGFPIKLCISISGNLIENL